MLHLLHSQVRLTGAMTCRKAIQQKVAAHKQAQADLSKSKPWRLTRQSMLINIVFAELLSEHELL